MGRILLVLRLAARDLRRRPTEALLLLLVIGAATTTLTLALLLHGLTAHPYQQTRAATGGPDAVASVFPPRPDGGPAADLPSLRALVRAHGVAGSSGPFPVTWSLVRTRGRTAGAMLEGRDPKPVLVDQPKVTQGTWIRPGGVVVERSFADALGVGVGDPISVRGRTFRVVGIAVTAAALPYPDLCYNGCDLNTPQLAATNPGLIWLPRGAALALATPSELPAYFLNLKLDDPALAQAFMRAHLSDNPTAPVFNTASDLAAGDAKLAATGTNALLVGSWLIGLLAVATVAVAVGGRIAEQTRRVGLLKAVGSTPAFTASLLLAEYAALALVAATVGLVLGRLCLSLFKGNGAGLISNAGTPPVTGGITCIVLSVALTIAGLATVIPALRAARASTVRALAATAFPPRRWPGFIAISGRLPVPLLLGIRLAVRRPRRVVLSAASVIIAVTTIVTVLLAHRHNQQLHGLSGLADPQTDRSNEAILIMTIALVGLAAINVIFITWATAIDTGRQSAIARALGTTPRQISAALSAAQALPALPAAIIGVPAGIGLYAVVGHTRAVVIPPLWWLAATVLATPILVAAVTAIPARIGARRHVAEVLQSEIG